MGGALWQFNGEEYVPTCTWIWAAGYEDLPDGGIKQLGARIEESTCQQKLIPQFDPPEN